MPALPGLKLRPTPQASSPFKDGDLFGVIFMPEHVFTVGDTVNLRGKSRQTS